MKDSVMKFAALVMIAVVFVMVAIADRWIDDPDPVSAETGISSSQISQPNRVYAEAGNWDAELEVEQPAQPAVRVTRSVKIQEQKQNNRSLAQRRAEWRKSRKEEEDDGGEPPDDREDKDVWRSYVIE